MPSGPVPGAAPRATSASIRKCTCRRFAVRFKITSQPANRIDPSIRRENISAPIRNTLAARIRCEGAIVGAPISGFGSHWNSVCYDGPINDEFVRGPANSPHSSGRQPKDFGRGPELPGPQTSANNACRLIGALRHAVAAEGGAKPGGRSTARTQRPDNDPGHAYQG